MQGTIDVDQQIMLIKATYQGEALREWGNCILNLQIADEHSMSEAELKTLRETHARYFFPKGALAKQRRYNHCYIRKPKFMKIHKNYHAIHSTSC